jgi:hypothetical protein
MKPRTFKILIIGLALLIFGPVLGYVLTLVGFFHAVSSSQQFPPGTIPDFSRTFSRILYSIIPVLVGALAGATGFFLVLLSLLTHFFRSKPNGATGESRSPTNIPPVKPEPEPNLQCRAIPFPEPAPTDYSRFKPRQ